jgi:membrane-bound lytic murein transglycosylase B|tara:strand:+ start:335 stop:1333 length:999 start_codon:yes stop_codon:yes gene_type:complete
MKIIKFITIIFFILSNFSYVYANNSFEEWKINFFKYAISQGVSEKTLSRVINDLKFLPKVIEYDRYQPEFYEDTLTYIDKRTNSKKVNIGVQIYKKNFDVISQVEKKFSIEKELLLSLMGIETNFGKYLGKMDILSSLATLSYDKRRSEFFTKELIIALKLIDNKKIKPEELYGSWAGAFGNFQFMPSTIQNNAIDYNNDSLIDLKSTEDSFASAANYLSKMGWDSRGKCFNEISLDEKTPTKYLNYSARKIKHKKKLAFYKKYIKNFNNNLGNDNEIVAIITPDKEIVENSNLYSPAYIIYYNFEIILKWNRSLRFALAVCSLKDKFKNEL